MKTWFLPPDFTFTAEGSFQLGTIIEHPKYPTRVLASPRTYAVPLPEVQVIEEANHTHFKEEGYSVGVKILAKLASFVSGSLESDLNHQETQHFSNVNHEIRCLTTPFPQDFLEEITSLETVRAHIDSGLFGKRPVYIVSGIRITKSSFKVTKKVRSKSHLKPLVSGPTIGTIDVKVSSHVSGDINKTIIDSYETAPSIIFAYRLHALRLKGSGTIQSELFSGRTAFLTGEAGSCPEIMEAVEVTPQILNEDIEEESNFLQEELGIGELCIRIL